VRAAILWRTVFACGLAGVFAGALSAQSTRVAILQAEDRRAPTARDLAVIRGGLHAGDAETVRVAVRTIGRLERASLVADIVPALRHPLPEVRAEAATAIAQALSGADQPVPSVRRTAAPPPATSAAAIESAMTFVTNRLNVEEDWSPVPS
jgi:hypothetical protein